MLRIRTTLILGILVGALIFGATAAHGAWYWNAWYWNAWYWNAETGGEGVNFRTAWTVVDSQTNESIDGDELNYHAKIELRVPKGASFTLLEQADTEMVRLKMDKDLECKSDGIEAEVSYKVRPLSGAQADKVVVSALDEASGDFHEKIELKVLIPADNPDCYGRR